MESSQGSDYSEGEEEQTKEVFIYYTEENGLRPNNEATLKKLKEQQERERMEERKLAKHQEEEKAMKNMEKAKMQEERERLRNERKRREIEEMKTKEEKEYLSNIKGNFGILINDIKKNQTPLELVMTGTDYKPVEIRLIFKALERNVSIRVKKLYFYSKNLKKFLKEKQFLQEKFSKTKIFFKLK